MRMAITLDGHTTVQTIDRRTANACITHFSRGLESYTGGCQILVSLDFDEAEDDLACPGCGCQPGDGYTQGCSHPDGCGFFRAE